MEKSETEIRTFAEAHSDFNGGTAQTALKPRRTDCERENGGTESKHTLIFRIFQILTEQTDETHKLRHIDIVDILHRRYGIECERKAVGRNIALLKDAGVDIESDKQGSYLATRQFENAELRLLIDSVLCSRHINSTHSRNLIAKLVAAGGKYFKAHTRYVFSVKDWNKSENFDFFLNIELVDEAIEREVKLRFDYNKVGFDKKLHKTAQHTVSPYQLILHNQRYYLMAFSEKFKGIAYYRLDKITNMDLTAEPLLPVRSVEGYESGINYRELSAALPYMYADKPQHIEIKCANWMIDELVDWFGYDVGVHKIDDDNFVASVLASPSAMAYWAMQYGTNCEVTYPQSLRDEIASRVRKMCDTYLSEH